MHQAPARQTPLDFPLYPPHSSYEIDRRKDTGLPSSRSQVAPVYLEAPIRAGLRTPPEDDMSATYQYPSYHDYTSKADATYPSMAAAVHGYSGSSVQSLANPTQPKPYSSLNNYPSQQAAVSIPKPTTALDVQAPYSKPPSPEQSSRSNTITTSDSISRRKGTGTSQHIVPSLQIPSTITTAGGNLAEFAAQVRWHQFYYPRAIRYFC